MPAIMDDTPRSARGGVERNGSAGEAHFSDRNRSAPARAAVAPRIYYVHPRLAGPLRGWDGLFAHIAAMGFDHALIAPPFATGDAGSLLLPAGYDRLDPALAWQGDAVSGLAQMAQAASRHEVSLWLDLVTDRLAAPGSGATAGPFQPPDRRRDLDPRAYTPDGDVAAASLDVPGGGEALVGWWRGLLRAWSQAGIAGYRLLDLDRLTPRLVRDLIAAAPAATQWAGWMPGVGRDRAATFADCGLTHVFSSFAWWDGRADWLWRESAALSRIAPVIHAAEAPFGERIAASLHDPAARRAAFECRVGLASALAGGWLLPMGAEYGARHRLDARRGAAEDFAQLRAEAPLDLVEAVTTINRARAIEPSLAEAGETRLLAGGRDVLAVLRPAGADARGAERAVAVIANLDIRQSRQVATAGLFANAGGSFVPLVPGDRMMLQPGEVLTVHARAARPILPRRDDVERGAKAAASAPRIALEMVRPSVDDGAFPARRCVGDVVAVEADVICDGHDKLGVALLWRALDEPGWQQARMVPLGNDRWTANLPLTRLGLHEFTIEAWRDAYATFADELTKKYAAGNDLTLELEEGRRLVAGIAKAAATSHRQRLETLLTTLRESDDPGCRDLLLDGETLALMREADPRPFSVRIAPAFPLEAERTAAAFASWYEIFPRSMSDDERRHGNFDDVIRHLPRIRDMGFDVLYFPPIHPIGAKNRKGRNNALRAEAGDVGSPYAIGSEAGGHDALHPELGSFEDFARLRREAAAHGLEIAIDFAIQCSPDHPWLREHPEWFAHRPDGTIRYAENPPKRYEDIVNVDFYAAGAIPGLWQALCEVVLFWCGHGVRIFRVDNPHTKPLPFWQWMIAEVKARHPDAMFLAEAFTRPKVMYRLAKVGFSQSYTYFTWRNDKAELTAYLEELADGRPRDFFRPNFFVNTPDINPVPLQTSGRPGYLARAALATTLAGLWGLYSGFELCEGRPLPGREEYLDSEKYQLRAWDWQRPGNIVAEVTALNAMRRANPALQTHLGVTFLPAGNDAILYFEKATADRGNVVLVAINLDFGAVQEADIELPLWRWNLPDDAALLAEDLVGGERFIWRGKRQHIRLDPFVLPYAIWRVRPAS